MLVNSYSSEDIIYNTLPLYHSSGGVLCVGACLINGNTVALRRKFSASRFWDDCVETKATVCKVTFFNIDTRSLWLNVQRIEWALVQFHLTGEMCIYLFITI